ncbi:hypothetical protein BDW02DRAFT_578714 [Decorospora gaudefroyi]|uniref:Uncharacterized protein n=1 Tax=Decorospora gaudefroyi TaxID=184978 RepID=A0A6A5KJ19_9PLEO|nr:hypothetical protein BDW02DRAFT_578714 [Decorospora gaudefroyi]
MGRFSLLAPLLLASNGVLGAKWIGEVKKVDGVTYKCKCYSDNACWPTHNDWDRLNKTVDGTLQLAIPPGAVCHNNLGNDTSVYDAVKCAETQANWLNEQWLTDHPIAKLWPLATNNTCLPTDDPSTPCTRGFYGRYVIVAKTKEQIKAGVDFAQKRNLRLIIRNTGHDFMGRSTGYGSLIINTHSFKDVKFLKKYTGPGDWTGSAAIVGAGVQGRELYRQCFAQTPPVVIVGGECPTVGWGGGYIQGGGHGPLTGIYGMGADNVLSFDAITADGKYVTANAKEHADLYWALKGGGPSTFAVVVSITVKTFPEMVTSGTILDINSTHTTDLEVFYKGFRIFHNMANHFSSNQMFVYFEQGPGPGRLHVAPFHSPNKTLEEHEALMEPLYNELDAAKIPYSTYTRSFPTFFEFYTDMYEDEQPNQMSIVGGRMFTMADLEADADGIADSLIFTAMPTATQLGFNVGHIVSPGAAYPKVDNAIHPTWRNASSFVITNVIMNGDESWEVKKEREAFNTNVMGKAMRDVSPYGASYVNEGDLEEPNWQEAYWGSNYARLLKIRKAWDPTDNFGCQPVQHHVLLVPNTEVLLTSRDKESNTPYLDLSGSEDFLASHVLRVPGGVGPNGHVKDAGSFRETRGKAKQFTTANGRTVIVKDAFVYSNKGFKTLNQAQLLTDSIFYPDSFDAQPWLVYFISRPLIGTFEANPIIPATLEAKHEAGDGLPNEAGSSARGGSSASAPRKKEVKSFTDLLNHFPMIARQMQPGLERLFKEFGKELEKPLPATPSHASRRSSMSSRRRGSLSSAETAPFSIHSGMSQGPNGFVSNLEISDEEDQMRRSLETAVTAAIDLFQMVDKQQLSLLGATTDLTGPIVERMIERYIAEQVHHTILFPRIQEIRQLEDADLERRTRQMVDIDISQVGIDIGHGRKGKQELAIRLSKAVDMFKKMGVAGSPQEMLEILLAVQKDITMPDESQEKTPTNGEPLSEKHDLLLTINADTLVSLLLIVVIRAPVRHLQARLAYMRHFIFIDDVESGEMGYALSTFEAVLSYLSQDSGGLRRASRRNRALWQATKAGDLATMQGILEPDKSFHADMDSFSDESQTPPRHRPVRFAVSLSDLHSLGGTTVNGDHEPRRRRPSPSHDKSTYTDGPLAHIFPFQRAQTPPLPGRPKMKKRVSMDTRSMSSGSARSFRSRTTLDSRVSAIEGDVSIEKLTMTQGPEGESVLMMAIESKQDKALQYLLSLTEYYTPSHVFEDYNNEGTNLLSAAVQLAYARTTDTILNYILNNSPSPEVLREYLMKSDSKGRCVAHYLFNQPRLIDRIGHLLPWRLKDKNGQTPVFALCRSYDHEEYHDMVDKALLAATYDQDDGQPLHLDEHVDNKGNSLLHIITDPQLATKLLYRCDSDVNATNDRQFTPLMVASKYGRTDMVRVLFQDPRVDLSCRDARGLTAVELAKDDDVRNRIDDLVLLSNEAGPDGRTTTVVRSFFVEDGTVRLVLKSGAPNDNKTITVTTCRRSSQDFENLAKWLAQEHPASWLPAIHNMASPYLIPSRPSRSILRDMQLRLDAFLKILLRHPTFSTHEMVWEFFLVPDIDSSMLAERSARKAELRVERLREEYAPIYDVREVELFVQHMRENIRALHHASRAVLRRANKVRSAASDLYDAAKISNTAVHSLAFLPAKHLRAMDRYTKTLNQSEASPMAGFYYSMHAISSTINAILDSLSRPSTLITAMSTAQKAIDRHNLSVRRSDRWPLGLLDDARSRVQRDAQEKMDKSKIELEDLGRELRYTQQVVAQELASWQENRVETGRTALKELARKMCVAERARLESMKRAVRELGIGVSKSKAHLNGVAETNGVAVQPDVSAPVLQHPRLDDVMEQHVEDGPGAVEHREDEGVVLSSGGAAAEEMVPADEVAHETRHPTNLAAASEIE